MTRSSRDAVEFVANPFVAFADFLIAILLIIILAFVYEAFYMNNIFERMALEKQQGKMLARLSAPVGGYGQAALSRALQNRKIVEVRDGDLQRFWFDDSLYFSPEAERKKPSDRWASLIAFGTDVGIPVGQGSLLDTKHRTFKRIIVEGHSYLNETFGPDHAQRAWSQAYQTALAAAMMLEQSNHDLAGLIEISCRGSSDQNIVPSQLRTRDEPVKPARLGIIIVYSAQQDKAFR